MSDTPLERAAARIRALKDRLHYAAVNDPTNNSLLNAAGCECVKEALAIVEDEIRKERGE